MLEKTLENPLDCKEIQSILKEINPEYLLEELMPTDETETSTFATDTKSQLVRKDPDAGKA